ncbi:zinc-binding alcohol dehydrogenase family protein [Agrobacterium sp. SOY23]|uniref:zinc-binding alcohol dehydrogenase family protein n=1 Tax=Agrobacterium sp. SOY23 TaxID=3014555 RepID=UPI0022AF5C64|nr:zinc-binding alcohol dehydrogenase family protein [Agrobacterium sp. SOY23]MCZ4433006.1 zinc-binding alcohol dehydrogenase family protein [Agrobacterium sp. SOY23]
MKSVGIFHSLPISDSMALVERDIPEPKPGDMDLLVRVEAISVNPADYRVRQRKANDGAYQVLGWDIAGTVIEVGPGVSGFSRGDAVFYAGDLTRPGDNSELHVVDERIVARRPVTLSAAAAAALPLTALTAWEALFERLGLSMVSAGRAKTLLIVGGAGGVGSVAIQLARLVPGLTVIATASRPESVAWCERLGAHAVIDHFDDMGAQIAARGLNAPDLILLTNSPDRHYSSLAELIAPQGVICSIVPFDTAPDLNLIMRKSVTFVWEFMFTRPMFQTSDMGEQGRILTLVADLVEAGQLVSTEAENLGLINAENLRTAHARLEQGRTIGKLVLAGF